MLWRRPGGRLDWFCSRQSRDCQPRQNGNQDTEFKCDHLCDCRVHFPTLLCESNPDMKSSATTPENSREDEPREGAKTNAEVLALPGNLR
jgi:hypothetical protein